MHIDTRLFDVWYAQTYERDSFESDEAYYDHRATARAGWNAAQKIISDLVSGILMGSE